MNITTLEQYTHFLCLLSTDDVFNHLATIGFTVHHATSKTKRYAVKQGSTITRPLVVCHADTVLESRVYKFDDNSGVVVSSELDDRLGIAVMLCLLLDGIDVSCLVCDNEETGRTTATQFVRETKLQPVWLTEFDRRGIDVVCYDYETPILVSMLQHCGFDVGKGSFSDISSMESLEVIGFNVGVGYHREHSLKCHANLNHTLQQVDTWLTWYNWLSSVHLAHEERTWGRSSFGKYYGSSASTVRYSSDDFLDKYTSKIIVDNPRVDDTWDDDLFDSPTGLELCDQCGNYCDSETMCDYSGGTVCENCIVDLRGLES